MHTHQCITLTDEKYCWDLGRVIVEAFFPPFRLVLLIEWILFIKTPPGEKTTKGMDLRLKW